MNDIIKKSIYLDVVLQETIATLYLAVACASVMASTVLQHKQRH